MPKQKALHLDGSHLEGGGQLLRLALSLSTLTSKPLHVTEIRGKRPPARSKARSKSGKGASGTGKGGGLKKSHVECVKFLSKACNAKVEGMEEGSSELQFWPGMVQNTKVKGKGRKDIGGGEGDMLEELDQDGVRSIEILQKTPGSIYLVLQALLPYILFGPYADSKLVRLRITGGTNVSHSPSHEYATQVLFPTLSAHLGVPPITATLVKRGWSSAAAGAIEMGEVVFEIIPLRQALPAFQIRNRGALTRVEIHTVSNPQELGGEIARGVSACFNTRAVEGTATDEGDPVMVECEHVLDEHTDRKNRIYALVIAICEDAQGKQFRIGRDCLHDGGKKGGEGAVGGIVKTLVREIDSELKNGGAVDEYMQDQLVVFQALAQGESAVERKEPSLHARTARWVAQRMLADADFGEEDDEKGWCKGVGFVPLGSHATEGNESMEDGAADESNLTEKAAAPEI